MYPKISIVTPSYNQADFLESTIRSVLGQHYTNLEYIVIDGGSIDGSVEIIERYASDFAYWVSERDGGHANALNKGFARTTGEIMGWINSDDILQQGALSLLAEIFTEFSEIEWLTGQRSYIDPAGRTVLAYHPPRYSRLGFLAGDYRWIQQESTYWRRKLWEKAGGYVSEAYQMAVDFELWVRFFRCARLYNMDGLIGSFRFNPRQRTRHAMDVYEREARQIILDEIASLDLPEFLAADAWTHSPLPLKYDWKTLRFVNANRLQNIGSSNAAGENGTR